MPCLLYGLDACPVNKTEARSLDFSVKRILMKIFHTTSNDVISECQLFFRFPPVHILVRRGNWNSFRNMLHLKMCCVIVLVLLLMINWTNLNLLNFNLMKIYFAQWTLLHCYFHLNCIMMLGYYFRCYRFWWNKLYIT